MRVIYRLRDSKESLRQMQEASLSHPFLGLKITHGLIGTEEWWENISTGKLPLCTVRGVVRGLWLGMYHSEPGSFAMELEDGTIFQHMTELDAKESAEVFKLGCVVEADYVLQEAKSPIQGLPKPSKVVLELRLDAELLPGIEPLGPCYYTWLQSLENLELEASSVETSKEPSRPPWWRFWR